MWWSTRGMRGVLLAAWMVLASVAAVRAEEKSRSLPAGPLTIDEAVGYGLAHNPRLKAAGEEVAATGQQVRQAQADFLPSLDTSYQFTHLSDQPFVSFAGSAQPGMPSQFPSAHTSTNRWDIVLTQPVFTGFGRAARLNISRLNVKISEYRLQEVRLGLIRDIQYAFLQTLLARKLLEVSSDNVKSLEVQRTNALTNYEQGLTPKNDVLKADVALAQARQQERTAAKQLDILRSRLNQLLNLDIDTALELSDEGIQLRRPPGIEELYSAAERQRPEYLALGTAIDRAEESITAERSRYYPHLSAFGAYYREGNDFLAETNDYTNNRNGAVGLRIDWNWFDGGRTRAAVKELQYRIRSVEEERRNLLEQIKVQVKDAYEQLEVARANIQTAEAALGQARENERLTTLQYKEQLVIFLEVLNAQVFVLQSQVDYLQALYGFQLAWADLERAVGGPIATN